MSNSARAQKPAKCYICGGSDFYWKPPFTDNYGNGPVYVPGGWFCNCCHPNPEEYETIWSSDKPNVITQRKRDGKSA